MPAHRPGPRHAGFGALLLVAATLVPATDTAADTAREMPTYNEPVADALVGELAGLSAFAAKEGLGRIELEQDAAPRGERQTRAALRALQNEDLDVARRLGGAQDEMTSERLLASLGDVLDLAALDRIEIAERSDELRCLAEAMYFEARGEGIEGQVAVAEVVLNRVESARYPDTVCGVVQQGADSGGACQFSYNCDGLKNRIANRPVYDRIGKLAWLMLQGRPRTLTDEALFFHATSVRPSWSRKFVRTTRIGRHIFYRPAVRLSMK